MRAIKFPTLNERMRARGLVGGSVESAGRSMKRVYMSQHSLGIIGYLTFLSSRVLCYNSSFLVFVRPGRHCDNPHVIRWSQRVI